MSLLTLLRPAPQRAPGKHTTDWLKQQQAFADLRAEHSAALEIIESLKRSHSQERVDWQQELDLADTESKDIAAERDEARTRSNANRDGWIRSRQELKEARAEVERLRATLLALEVPVDPDAAPGQPALMDDPQAWINQPDGPPRPDEWISPVAPVAPVDSEAADVNAKTQLTDVRDLRTEAETQPVDVTALRNATGLGATAVLPVVAAPPLPDCKPPMPGEVTVVDAVLPLWQQSVPVSLGTGQRARDSVAAALLP
jgi:hypothetical protein